MAVRTRSGLLSRAVPRTRRVAVLALLAVPLAGLAPAARAVEPLPPDSGYRMRVLEVPRGYRAVSPEDMNEHGQVAGSVTPSDRGARPAWWDEYGHLHWLPTPGAVAGQAARIDDRGRIVGTLQDASGETQAVLWRNGGLPEPLGARGRLMLPERMNGSGQVAGRAGVLWAPARFREPLAVRGDSPAPLQLGDLDDTGALYSHTAPEFPPVPGTAPTAWKFTAAGQQVDLLAGVRAQGVTPEKVYDVQASESGVVTVLLHGRRGGQDSDVAYALLPGRAPLVLSPVLDADSWGVGAPVVNDRGMVVASEVRTLPSCAKGNQPTFHMIAWDPLDGLRKLPRSGLPCGEDPIAINDAGEVVGALYLPGSAVFFVWDAAGGYRQLTSGGLGSMQRPLKINQLGSVLGVVRPASGPDRAVVWDPPGGRTIAYRAAAADTWVSESVPDQAAGEATSLTAGRGAQALLRFAVPAPLNGRHLVAAKLQLTVATGPDAGTAWPLEVRAVTGAWSEGSTWASRPAVGARTLGHLGAAPPGEPVSVRIDPADVPARGGTLDLAVVGTNADLVRFASREAADASTRPALELIYR